MQTGLMQRIVSIEYFFAAALIALFFVVVGKFDWWWLVVLFVFVDVSAAGYFFNNRIGALTYNLGHSLIGPGLLAIIYIFTTSQVVLFIILLWLFHIFVDRTLGYGMKHTTSFQHTHLGKIGKEKQKKV